MTLTRSKGTILSKPSQTGQHHWSEGCCASLGQSGKDLLKVSAQKFHSCSPGSRATSGAGSRNWPHKHRPCSTHFKGIKDARLRESWKVVKARYCVSGFGEAPENHWVGQLPKEQTDISFQNISVDQPIICNKKECSALRVKNLAFKVLCGVDHTAHVLFERFSLGRIIFFLRTWA